MIPKTPKSSLPFERRIDAFERSFVSWSQFGPSVLIASTRKCLASILMGRRDAPEEVVDPDFRRLSNVVVDLASDVSIFVGANDGRNRCAMEDRAGTEAFEVRSHEMKALLADSPPSLRRAVAWHLWKMFAGDGGADFDRGATWHSTAIVVRCKTTTRRARFVAGRVPIQSLARDVVNSTPSVMVPSGACCVQYPPP